MLKNNLFKIFNKKSTQGINVQITFWLVCPCRIQVPTQLCFLKLSFKYYLNWTYLQQEKNQFSSFEIFPR